MPILRKRDVSATKIPVLALNFLRGLFSAIRMMRRTKPDVVYVNTLVIPHWLLAARILGVPSICHVRETEDDFSVTVQRALLAPLFAARAVVANSRSTASWVRGVYPALMPRTRVIHNGKDWAPYLQPVRSAVPPEPVLVVAGRLSERKGQDIALEAVIRLRQEGRRVRLHLAGDVFPGNEGFAERLYRRMEFASLPAGVVTMLGFVEDVPRVFAASHVAIVPSRQEPFGTVAAEALAAGLPTIAADVQGLAEIITDRVDGLLFVPGDVASLTDRLRTLLDDWKLAQELALQGQAKVLREFGPERYAAELVRVLDDQVGVA